MMHIYGARSWALHAHNWLTAYELDYVYNANSISSFCTKHACMHACMVFAITVGRNCGTKKSQEQNFNIKLPEVNKN